MVYINPLDVYIQILSERDSARTPRVYTYITYYYYILLLYYTRQPLPSLVLWLSPCRALL